MLVGIRSDIRLHVDVSSFEHEPGRPDRDVILVIPGGPGSGALGAKAQLRPLWDRYQMIFVELRGSGRSTKSSPSEWLLTQWVDDLVLLVRRLGVQIRGIVGLSFGGIIATFLSARLDEGPERLALVSTYPRFRYRKVLEALTNQKEYEARRSLETLYEERSLASALEYRRCMNQVFERRLTSRDTIAGDEAGSRNLDVYAHFVSGEMFTFSIEHQLSNLTIPVQVIIGNLDPLVSGEAYQRIVKRSSGVRQLIEIENAGHLLGIEQPGLLCEAITAFFDGNVS